MQADLHKSLIERAMRARRWHRAEHGSLRRRLWAIVTDRRHWWNWGHPVMTLTGRENCGNYDSPRGRGVRRWIYLKALHAAVERKIPFTCQVTPDRNSGGYTHWHCQLKKRHEGKHRFGNYTWIGRDFQVEYEPAAS